LIDYNITIELGLQSSMASLSMASRYSTLSRLAVSPTGQTPPTWLHRAIRLWKYYLFHNQLFGIRSPGFCCMSLHVFVHNILSPPFLQYHTFLLVFPHWILWCPPIDLMNQVEENQHNLQQEEAQQDLLAALGSLAGARLLICLTRS